MFKVRRRAWIWGGFICILLLVAYNHSNAEEKNQDNSFQTFPYTADTDKIATGVSYNLGVLGDMNFTTKSRAINNNSFYIGEFDLYGTATYDRTSFLSEILVEFEEGNTDTVMDVERLWIGYTFSDYFITRFGRHHTSLGYWNRTFHHGKQLFTTIDRPMVIAWEHTGIIPMHIVGIEFEGRFNTNIMSLKYELQIGNGPGITNKKQLDPNNSSDNNPSKQWVLRLSASDMLPHLTVGISGTNYKISQNPVINEKIIGIDISYTDGIELLGEYFKLWNSDKAANLFYLQAGYFLPNYSVTPYIRYDWMNVADGDPYMIALGDRHDHIESILGLRYDVNERNSIKTQYRRDNEKGSDIKNVFEVQWAFNF